MKKIILLFLGVTFIALSCQKDPELPIDKFTGTFTGQFKEYECDSVLISKNIFDDYSVVFESQSETELTGKLLDTESTQIFSFQAEMNANDNTKIKIKNFSYNGETLFGGGEFINNKLNLQFATTACPSGENTYRVTRVFDEL